ncbi:hypothetical protein IscW_ISCW001523 [Ixodes scapularis]|uniref:Uncharacterized protein n=1 Tax=Ixodes scapularis TaxID=6945 RepID=B7P2P2_IXOSC|nr:hypothetical protein IscW_ISCW001523 [Ixodes scapularis]|eukprot:XP_002402672.1 hypothetical protein IscW_ISCW001523 [Ixodes scapularis]
MPAARLVRNAASSSYALFLRHAVSAVQTRYMLALKGNSLASHVPLGLALSVLHIQHRVRGFGFLDVGLSRPGHTLTQYTSLLRIEVSYNRF